MSLSLPEAPNSIQKGVPLKVLLDRPAIEQLAYNLHFANSDFNQNKFIESCMENIEPLALKDRANHIAKAMKRFLPPVYTDAIQVVMDSFTPPLTKTEDNGLASMFYMPHASFIGDYGLDKAYNAGKDPFDISMKANYELTKRFTAEFSIRNYIIDQQERTFTILHEWMKDPDPHVRRLCTEGPRPRLPWAPQIPSLIEDPTPSIAILEHLKDDPNLYVRRSVANHVGDIAKDHLNLALDLCESWLKGASKELKWVIRHAVRHPFKKGNERAIQLRKDAK